MACLGIMDVVLVVFFGTKSKKSAFKKMKDKSDLSFQFYSPRKRTSCKRTICRDFKPGSLHYKICFKKQKKTIRP